MATAKAKVLIVGDSISMGYFDAVVRGLAGLANVEHNPENGGTSENVRKNIVSWLAVLCPNIVLLNCGLHDVKRERTAGEINVPLKAYMENLVTILEKIRAAGAHTIWVSTTPVIEYRHQAVKDFDRLNADIDDYDAAADAIMDRADVPIIPLYEFAIGLGLETALTNDGVHFTPAAYEQLGEVIADALREVLE